MTKNKKIIIWGASKFAELAAFYFNKDSEYSVVAYTVDDEYLAKEKIGNLPVVAFSRLKDIYSPQEHEIFIATGYKDLGLLRCKKVNEVSQLGYKLANYISSDSTILSAIPPNSNIMIQENVTIQPFCKISEGTIFFTGSVISHDSTIGPYSYIAPNVTVCGHVNIGEHCFLGAAATIKNNINVMNYSLIGIAALVMEDTIENSVIYNKTEQITIKDSALNFAAKI